eukprot:2558845-Pleurochrysis_carterae.AAC.4
MPCDPRVVHFRSHRNNVTVRRHAIHPCTAASRGNHATPFTSRYDRQCPFVFRPRISQQLRSLHQSQRNLSASHHPSLQAVLSCPPNSRRQCGPLSPLAARRVPLRTHSGRRPHPFQIRSLAAPQKRRARCHPEAPCASFTALLTATLGASLDSSLHSTATTRANFFCWNSLHFYNRAALPQLRARLTFTN